MTVPSTDITSGPYVGNGLVDEYDYDFGIDSKTELIVYETTAAGVTTELTVDTDYTVNIGDETGGTVTRLAGNLPTGYTWYIRSNFEETQETAFESQGGFFPSVHEAAFDKLTKLVQQNSDRVNRSFRIADSDSSDVTMILPGVDERKGKIPFFSETDGGVEVVDPGTFTTIVAYADSFADTFTGDGSTVDFVLSEEPANLYQLDVSIQGVTQVPTTNYTLSGSTISFTTAPPLNQEILVRYAKALPDGYEGTADNIEYTPAGTGAVSRTVANKLYETVSVKDFGAVGDGVTDDTAAIQAAIDSGNVNVFFPEGEYLVSSQIILPASSFYANDKVRVFSGSGATILAGISLSHIIAGPSSGYASRWLFEKLTYTSADGTSYAGIFDVTSIYNSWFKNNTFTNVNSSVFYTGDYSQSLTIESNHFGSCHFAVDIQMAYTLTFSENNCEGCDNGVWITSSNDPAMWAGRIQNNVFEGSSEFSGDMPIYIGACYGVVISGNYMEANNGSGVTTHKCYINLNASNVPHRGLVISNNMFQPTAAQKADADFSVINLNNYPVTDINSRPAVFGNVCSGPVLVNDPSLLSAYYSNLCTGQDAGEVGPIIQNKQAWISSASLSFLDNRSTAYDSGSATWDIFKITDVDTNCLMSFDGMFRMYNVGGTLCGVTYFTFKIGFCLVGSTVTPVILDQISLVEQEIETGGGSYWNSGGTSVIGTSVTGNDCLITLNYFNDVSIPSIGTVYSLGPVVSSVVTHGSYKNIQITYP